jgi:hypothetical protein
MCFEETFRINESSIPKAIELLGCDLFLELLRSPNRRKTSEQVTKIEMIIKIMMIQVMSESNVNNIDQYFGE